MMKMTKGKSGRSGGKVDYDSREENISNIYTLNFDTDNITDISELKQSIVENIKVECVRKNSNEYIAFVIAPPPSRELVSAILNKDIDYEKYCRDKMKVKTISLAAEFLTSQFPLTKSTITAHERQSLPHAHLLVSPKTLDGKTVRIENLKELQKQYHKLLEKYFPDELAYLEERKEKNEVLDADFNRSRYVVEKREGKRESFAELIKKIEDNKNYNDEKAYVEKIYAKEKIDEMKYDEYQKDVMKEEVEYYNYCNEEDNYSRSRDT